MFADAETFKENWKRYNNLAMRCDTKPYYNGFSLNKELARIEERVKTSVDEKNQLRDRVKSMMFDIYNSDNEYDERKCSVTLKLKAYPETTKYREMFRRLEDFIKCEPFIYEIMDDNRALREHVYGSDEPEDFRFHPYFIKCLKSLIKYKQFWLKRTEEIKSSDNNSYYGLVADGIDYIVETPRSNYATGYGPLTSPFQQ